MIRLRIKSERNKIKRNVAVIKLLLIVFAFSYCHDKKEKMKFSMSVSPSSGGDFGYLFSFQDSLIILEKKKVVIDKETVRLHRTVEKTIKQLTPPGRDSLYSLIKDIELVDIKQKPPMSLDTWIFEFESRDKEVILSKQQLQQPQYKNYKSIAMYLLGMFKEQVFLRSFS